jgi:hypothetical protein
VATLKTMISKTTSVNGNMLTLRDLLNVFKECFTLGAVTSSFVLNMDMSNIDAIALILKPDVKETRVTTVVVVTVEIMADNRCLYV